MCVGAEPTANEKNRRNGKILEGKSMKRMKTIYELQLQIDCVGKSVFNCIKLFTRSKSINKYVCTKKKFCFKFNSIIFERINTYHIHTLFLLYDVCFISFFHFSFLVSLFTVPKFFCVLHSLVVEKEGKEEQKKNVAVH